jgi:glycine dehydrogenase subunit 2
MLGEWLIRLTGMHSVAMSPKAGAHGELCGLLAMRAALEARGDARQVILVPESAHGTNPATAAFAGYRVENIPANERGRVDLAALKASAWAGRRRRDDHQPNTCGLFEPDMKAISEAVHAAAASSTATAPISTRSSAESARAISASTRCTSTSTRPSPRPTAAAARARSGCLSEALTPFAPMPFVESRRAIPLSRRRREVRHMVSSFGG